MELYNAIDYLTYGTVTASSSPFVPTTTFHVRFRAEQPRERALRLSNAFADRAAWAFEHGFLTTAEWCAEAADELAGAAPSSETETR